MPGPTRNGARILFRHEGESITASANAQIYFRERGRKDRAAPQTCRRWHAPPSRIKKPVSARVGNVKNNDPTLIEPIAA